MIKLAEACERIAGTTKKLEKTAIVAEYLKSRHAGGGVRLRDLSFRPAISCLGRDHSASRRHECCGGSSPNSPARAKPNSPQPTASTETWARSRKRF